MARFLNALFLIISLIALFLLLENRLQSNGFINWFYFPCLVAALYLLFKAHFLVVIYSITLVVLIIIAFFSDLISGGVLFANIITLFLVIPVLIYQSVKSKKNTHEKCEKELKEINEVPDKKEIENI